MKLYRYSVGNSKEVRLNFKGDGLMKDNKNEILELIKDRFG